MTYLSDKPNPGSAINTLIIAYLLEIGGNKLNIQFAKACYLLLVVLMHLAVIHGIVIEKGNRIKIAVYIFSDKAS